MAKEAGFSNAGADSDSLLPLQPFLALSNAYTYALSVF
jgi:hypothetical protein